MKFVKEKTGLYKLEGKGIPETYLMHSEPSQQILLHPEIAGKELKELAIKANAEFIKKAYPICLKGKRIDKICELVLMCGGNYYGTREAFENEFNASLRQAFIGVKRYQEDSKWKAAIGYSNFEALPDDATVIIADTIATGSTLKEAIVELGRQAEKKNYNLDSIIVYTLAGTEKGAKALKQSKDMLNQKWPNLKMRLFASEALFGLEENGTDMSFRHINTTVTPEMEKALENNLALAHTIKCAIFDWGDRCKNPAKHYEEFIRYCAEMIGNESNRAVKEELIKRKEKAENELEKLKRAL